MSEMVERVALALDKKLGDDLESLSLEMGCGSDLSKKMRADSLLEAARAAIESMREPTGDMTSDGACAADDLSQYGAASVYRFMIDAALK